MEKAKATFPEKSPKAGVTFVRSLVTGRTLALFCPKRRKVSKETKNKQNESGNEKAAVSKSEKNKEKI